MSKNLFDELEEVRKEFSEYLEKETEGKTFDETIEFLTGEFNVLMKQLEEYGVIIGDLPEMGPADTAKIFLVGIGPDGTEINIDLTKEARSFSLDGAGAMPPYHEFPDPQHSISLTIAQERFKTLFPDYLPIGPQFDAFRNAIYAGIRAYEPVLRQQIFDSLSEDLAEALANVLPDDEQ